MKRLSAFLLPVAALVMMIPASRAQTPTLPPGEGKDLVETQCASCHGLEGVVAQRATREGWEGIVEYMMSRGMVASDEEVKKMVDYLAKAFPPNPAKGKAK